MSRLNKRLADLEQRFDPPAPKAWVRMFQYDGQSYEEAVAAWETENGAVDDRNIIMRVIVHKPFPPEGRPTGDLCPA